MNDSNSRDWNTPSWLNDPAQDQPSSALGHHQFTSSHTGEPVTGGQPNPWGPQAPGAQSFDPAWRPSSQPSASGQPGSQPSAGWQPGSQPSAGWQPESQPSAGWQPESQPSDGWQPQQNQQQFNQGGYQGQPNQGQQNPGGYAPNQYAPNQYAQNQYAPNEYAPNQYQPSPYQQSPYQPSPSQQGPQSSTTTKSSNSKTVPVVIGAVLIIALAAALVAFGTGVFKRDNQAPTPGALAPKDVLGKPVVKDVPGYRMATSSKDTYEVPVHFVFRSSGSASASVLGDLKDNSNNMVDRRIKRLENRTTIGIAECGKSSTVDLNYCFIKNKDNTFFTFFSSRVSIEDMGKLANDMYEKIE